jgi:hypothetical protein
MIAGSSQYDCTSLVSFATRKFNNFILSNNEFLDCIAVSHNFIFSLWVVECRQNLSSQSGRNSFNTFKICMLNNHNAFFYQKLFWIIIDQLSVNVNCWFIRGNSINFLFHFLFLSLRYLSDFL